MTDFSPTEWRDFLDQELVKRHPRIKLYRDYYDGDHRMQFATSQFKEAFGELFGAFATNWCGLVIDVAAERLSIQGFRFGEDTASDDAWAMWQANSLDAGSLAGHTEALKCETAYLLVGPPRTPGAEPVITVEHPDQCIVAHDPSDRRLRLAGLKKYVDARGDQVCIVWTPDLTTTFRRDGIVGRLLSMGVEINVASVAGWEITDQVVNQVQTVPLIPLENAPDLLTGGRSDLKPAISLNDAANKFFTDMIHASEFTAFPQRVMIGAEIPRDPVTQEPLEGAELKAMVNRVWILEDPAASVFQLAAGDLSNYVEGIDLAVQHLAAQTRTPPHYLLAKLANISADALKAAETGLVARCRRKHLDFSDPWEEAMRLGFLWRAIVRKDTQDAERAMMLNAETIWVDPESKDPISLAQSLLNRQSIGVPQEILWEEAGYTPQQIKRMKLLREVEMKAQADREFETAKRLRELQPPPPVDDPRANGRARATA